MCLLPAFVCFQLVIDVSAAREAFLYLSGFLFGIWQILIMYLKSDTTISEAVVVMA